MPTQADYIKEPLERARREFGPDDPWVKQLERQLAGIGRAKGLLSDLKMGARAPVGKQGRPMTAIHAGSPLLLQPLQPRFDIAQFKRFSGLADQGCQPARLSRQLIAATCLLDQDSETGIHRPTNTASGSI